MNKYCYYALIFIIFAWGIFLRYFDLGSSSMWIDEGYSSLVSYYTYVNHFLPLLLSGEYNFSWYMHTFFQSSSFFVFGVSDFSARFPSFLFGIIALGIVFLFSNEVLKDHRYQPYGVLFLLFLFTFSTWQIAWSREARFYEMLSLVYLLGVYLLYKYLQSQQRKYILSFFTISLFGLIFHPFCFALFGIGVLIIAYESVEKYIQTKTWRHILLLLIPIISFLLYLVVRGIFSYISGGDVSLSGVIPGGFDMTDEIKKAYTWFYLNNLVGELGIVFFFYLLGILYLLLTQQFKAFILWGLLVGINFYVITQKGYMAHSRYMFHLYGMITLVGGYTFFMFATNLYTKFAQSVIKKSFSLVVIGLFLGTIGYTYSLNFFPEKIYYIDFTSPKPNFKLAYETLSQKKDVKIVSGFPHMCYWYNLKNPSVCEYALNINLTGSKESLKTVQNQTFNHYTQTPYIKYISQIDTEKYYFVLDDLTLKNAVDSDIIDYVKTNCAQIYTDIGNGESENFIGIWKCDT